MAQPAATAVLADRYGRRASPGGRHRLATALGTLLAASLLAWAAWVGVSARSAVHARDGAFTRVDDGHARLVFEVTAPVGTHVVCTVRMLNQGLTEVGRLDVDAGPSPDRSFSVTADVPTFEAATTGTVRACAAR